MIKFFRHIRQRMLNENRFSRYLLYAIGEIVLVVIGILIALQINNNNDLRRARAREVKYLENIKSDLLANQDKVKEFIAVRTDCIGATQRVIAKIDGDTIADWRAFNEDCISIYAWQRYYPINFTFKELMNTGGLAQLTNDSLKTALLKLEQLFEKFKAEEDHFRFDSEEVIYKPLYELKDMGPMIDLHMKKDVALLRADYDRYFADVRVKNGFLMAFLEFSTMNGQLNQVLKLSDQLIAMIDRELARGA
ncbi:MAG: hypothetical protein IPL52_09020 [Flavobacteriales bacterium]|nr:hypothetical protein [Flavobacteriales bacterium]